MKDFNIYESGNKVLTESVINGIDINNVIASGSSNTNYTATQDCYYFADVGYSDSTKVITIDNKNILGSYHSIFGTVPLKKGQVAKTNTSGSYKVYGVKR